MIEHPMTMERVPTDTTARTEHELKRERIREMLDRFHLNALHLSLPANVAWYADGGRVFVNLSADRPLLEFVVTKQGEHIFINSTERQRIVDEEFRSPQAEIHVNHWWDDAERSRTIRTMFGSHVASDAEVLKREVARLRYGLLPEEIVRYRSLGKDVAGALFETSTALRAGMTEFEAAAELSGHLLRTGTFPLVVLAAFDERIKLYRHPMPTQNTLAHIAMLSVCGMRNGLIASATRFVSVKNIPADLQALHRTIISVDASLIGSTKAGAAVSEIFSDVKRQYAAAGIPDEWRLHHQGGATGYAVRDYRASDRIDEIVQMHQAFAWNPTITGMKSEDTILVGENGPEILTVDDRWPVVMVHEGAAANGRSIARPDILKLD